MTVDSAAVAVLALLLLLGGAVVLLSKQRLLPWTFPALRFSESARAAERLPPALSPPSAERQEQNKPSHLELVPAPGENDGERRDRIGVDLKELQRIVEQQGAALIAEMRHAHALLLAQAEAAANRQSAAYDRFHAEVLAAIAGAVADRRNGASDRAREVSAELYARLARLEAALSTVTNPILLPGEAYQPPAEFLPEALIWENWNEVGERVFALADAFSAQRLHLSAQSRSEFGEIITTLRMLLTRSVYPNLRPEIDPTQQATLRAALGEIAALLPRVRAVLEREYQEGWAD